MYLTITNLFYCNRNLSHYHATSPVRNVSFYHATSSNRNVSHYHATSPVRNACNIINVPYIQISSPLRFRVRRVVGLNVRAAETAEQPAAANPRNKV